jgi:CRP-like cAMP-binding protein
MKANEFRNEVQRDGPLAPLLLRYTHTFLVQAAQAGACNQLHSVQQRCARWLLMCNERVGRDEFALTQEFLCQMLSVRRATVSEVASALQAAGLIRYTRGRMTIVDRAGLEAVSCECYQVIRAEYDRAFSRA